MSPRGTNIAVACVAGALVAGGIFIGVRGLSDDAGPPDSLPEATVPRATAPPPAPAVVETVPVPTLPDGSVDDGLLPVPNVLGTSEAIALSRLDDFDVQVTRVQTTIPEDFDEVTAQDPAGAARLEAGGTVEVVFSERPRPETIDVEPFPVGEFDLVDLDGLEIGECGVRRLVDRVLVFDPIDCAQAHDLELIARVDIDGAPDVYDAEVLADLVEDQCAAEFELYIGLPLGDSALISYALRPNPDDYAAGERTATCALRNFDGIQLIGSAAGTFW